MSEAVVNNRMKNTTISCLSLDESLLAVAASSSGDSERIKCYKVVLVSPPSSAIVSTVSSGTLQLQLQCTLVKKSATNVLSAEIKLHRMSITSQNDLVVSCYTNGVVNVWDLKRGVICQTIEQQQQQFSFVDCCFSISNSTTVLHVLFCDISSKKYIIYEYTFTAAAAKEDQQLLQLTRKIKAGTCKNIDQVFHQTQQQQHVITANQSYIALLLPGSKGNKLRFLHISSGKRANLQQTTTSVSSTSNPSSVLFMENSNNTIMLAYHDSSSYCLDLCEYSSNDHAEEEEDALVLSTTTTYTGFTSMPTKFALCETSSSNSAVIVLITCMDGTVFICNDKNGSTKTTSLQEKFPSALFSFFHKGLPNTIGCIHRIKKDVSIQTVVYHHDQDNNEILLSQGNASNEITTVSTSTASNNDSTAITTSDPSSGGGNKRKRLTVMGPGETLNVTSGSIHDLRHDQQKKRRKNTDDDDDAEDSSFWDIIDHGSVININDNTIADRITALHQQAEHNIDHFNDDDDSLLGDIDDDLPLTKSNKTTKASTAAALTVIVRQALQSSNETQLEEAFSVTDEKVVKNTIASMMSSADEDLIWTLLLKIIHRISKKPSRAVWLGGVWLKTILEYHSSAFLKLSSEEEGSSLVYNVLGPLVNMLKERTEILPHLMKLQGRLDMVSRRHGI